MAKIKKCSTCELLGWQQCKINCGNKDFNPNNEIVKHNNETLAVIIEGKIIGFTTTESFKKGVIAYHVKKETFNRLNNIKEKGDQLSLF